MRVEGISAPPRSSAERLGSGSLPPCALDLTGESSTHGQHVESERDDFGTVVTEVTTVTTSTRKRYRVEDA